DAPGAVVPLGPYTETADQDLLAHAKMVEILSENFAECGALGSTNLFHLPAHRRSTSTPPREVDSRQLSDGSYDGSFTSHGLPLILSRYSKEPKTHLFPDISTSSEHLAGDDQAQSLNSPQASTIARIQH
ncbi:unnamed protein product, partial [Amoebophrya sp. A120]